MFPRCMHGRPSDIFVETCYIYQPVSQSLVSPTDACVVNWVLSSAFVHLRETWNYLAAGQRCAHSENLTIWISAWCYYSDCSLENMSYKMQKAIAAGRLTICATVTNFYAVSRPMRCSFKLFVRCSLIFERLRDLLPSKPTSKSYLRPARSCCWISSAAWREKPGSWEHINDIRRGTRPGGRRVDASLQRRTDAEWRQ